MKLPFTKMHGLENDFVIIDCREEELRVRSSELGDLSKKLCHRRLGIGADQLLLLYPSSIADFKMRVFNADGGEVEMCGNGIRCIAKYIWDRNLSVRDVFKIETIAGIIKPERAGDMVRVDMGEPILEAEKIPVKLSQKSKVKSQKSEHRTQNTDKQFLIIDLPLHVKKREFKISCVSMGNPHAVIFVNKVDAFPVGIFGPDIESHPLFPNKTNIEFVEVLSRDEIKIRVWERGVGETMACGTGASASAVASNIKGLTDRKVTVHLLGGDLFIEWSETDNHVYMTGPAVEVFEGMVEV